jgi:hypothetical protein
MANESDDRLEGDPVWELFAQPASSSTSRRLEAYSYGLWVIAGGLLFVAWFFDSVLAMVAACLAVGAPDFLKGRSLGRSIPDKAGATICARFTYAWGAWKFAGLAMLMIFVWAALIDPKKHGGEVPAIFPVTIILWAGGFTGSAALTASGLFSAYRAGMRVWVGEGVNRARFLLLGMLMVAFALTVLGPLCIWLAVLPRENSPIDVAAILLPVFSCIFVGPVIILVVLDFLSRRVVADRPGKFGPKVPAVGKWN